LLASIGTFLFWGIVLGGHHIYTKNPTYAHAFSEEEIREERRADGRDSETGQSFHSAMGEDPTGGRKSKRKSITSRRKNVTSKK